MDLVSLQSKEQFDAFVQQNTKKDDKTSNISIYSLLNSLHVESFRLVLGVCVQYRTEEGQIRVDQRTGS